jgi:hypothetical protein
MPSELGQHDRTEQDHQAAEATLGHGCSSDIDQVQ